MTWYMIWYVINDANITLVDSEWNICQFQEKKLDWPCFVKNGIGLLKKMINLRDTWWKKHHDKNNDPFKRTKKYPGVKLT